ncbi:MAG: hypothetical protein IKD94_07435 [Erysipelotrichaceae bacterium]|nr:hypothetical protein [Erysipelotrichaceae bacterium]
MKKSNKRNILIMILCLILVTGCFLFFLNRNSTQVSAPTISKDERLPGGYKSTWDCVYFGEYPKSEVSGSDALVKAEWINDETESDGKRYKRVKDGKDYRYFIYEPLRWRVIEKNDNKAVLLSDQIIDSAPYNYEATDVNWENCDLRLFIHEEIYENAFTDKEKQSIINTDISNLDNYYFGTECGEDTSDYIYILSEEDIFYSDKAAAHGFSRSDGVTDLSRRFMPTEYAIARGAWASSSTSTKGLGYWILRTNGYSASNAVYVSDIGAVYNRGTYVNCLDAGVLPAITVDLKTAELVNAGKVSSDELYIETSSDSGMTVDYLDYAPVDNGTYSEPVIEKEETLSSGYKTTWDCVYFGQYPASEIMETASNPVDEYAIPAGGIVVDEVLIAALENAVWENDETVIDDVKYRRIKSDTSNFEPQYYQWTDADTYHYFRYEPLRWRIIEINDDEIMLICDKLPDCAPYNRVSEAVNWQDSYLRKFLNDEFYDHAFSEKEKEAIIEKQIENNPNRSYGTDCGNTTSDKVFVLSGEEVYQDIRATRHGFYPYTGVDDPAKRFKPTMYAMTRGTWYSPVEAYRGNGFWFMRTNGYSESSVTYICDMGYIYEHGTDVSCADSGVLPVVCVDSAKAELIRAGKSSSIDTLKN